MTYTAFLSDLTAYFLEEINGFVERYSISKPPDSFNKFKWITSEWCQFLLD